MLPEKAIFASLEKSGSDQHSVANFWDGRKISEAKKELIQEFCQRNLKIQIELQSTISEAGSYLYQICDNLPNLLNHKMIHPGCWLGVIKEKKRVGVDLFRLFPFGMGEIGTILD